MSGAARRQVCPCPGRLAARPPARAGIAVMDSFVSWPVSGPVGWWSAGLGGWEELGLSVVGEAYLPGGVVDGAVVVAAEQDQVVECGRAAVEPVADVVGVAHHRRVGCTRGRRIGVAGDQGGPDRGGDQSLGAAVVEDASVGVEQDPDQVAVTRQPPDRRTGQLEPVFGDLDPGGRRRGGLGVDGDREPWPGTVVAGGRSVSRACWASRTSPSHMRAPWSRGSGCSSHVTGSIVGDGFGQRQQRRAEQRAVLDASRVRGSGSRRSRPRSRSGPRPRWAARSSRSRAYSASRSSRSGSTTEARWRPVRCRSVALSRPASASSSCSPRRRRCSASGSRSRASRTTDGLLRGDHPLPQLVERGRPFGGQRSGRGPRPGGPDGGWAGLFGNVCELCLVLAVPGAYDEDSEMRREDQRTDGNATRPLRGGMTHVPVRDLPAVRSRRTTHWVTVPRLRTARRHRSSRCLSFCGAQNR